MLYNLPLPLRQLEQQESKNKSEMDDFLIRLSSLQEENRILAVDKANLTADVKRMEAEQELTKQANRSLLCFYWMSLGMSNVHSILLTCYIIFIFSQKLN